MESFQIKYVTGRGVTLRVYSLIMLLAHGNQSLSLTPPPSYVNENVISPFPVPAFPAMMGAIPLDL